MTAIHWLLPLVVLTSAAHAEPDYCSCPQEPVALIRPPGGPFLVSPARIPEGFSGCQVGWDDKHQARMRITYKGGAVERYEHFSPDGKPTLSCVYENDSLMPGSSAACAQIMTKWLRVGMVPPGWGVFKPGQLGWPAGQCFPSKTAWQEQKPPAQPVRASAYGPVLERADDMLDDVAAGRDTRMVDEIVAALEAAVTASPDDAVVHMMLGRAYIQRDCSYGPHGCALRAKAHLTKAIQLQPKLLRAHVLLAHDAMNSGCVPCAQPHVEAGLPLDARDPYLLEVQGRWNEMLGVTDTAEYYYRRAIEGYTLKKRWGAYTFLGGMYQRQGELAKAEKAYLGAVESRPAGAWSHGNLAGLYIFALGDYEKAIPEFRKALSILNYGHARRGLALALYERWGDAYLQKKPQAIVSKYWAEALAENPDKTNMFYSAAQFSGTHRGARALLESGEILPVDLERRLDHDRTPLLQAIWNDNFALADLLLEHGANPNVRDPGGMTVAHVAAGTGNLALMRHLVRRKANLTVVTPETNETVLMVVAKSGAKHPDRIKIAELVLGAGAPIDHRDASGNTALVDATAFGDIEMVKFLMSRNASADVVLPSGFTPAAIAVEHNNPELLQLFISKRAGLNARVEGGLTLIQYAEKLGHRELADMLRRIDRS